ncbi:MAG: ABC transporter ATP-binding protein [Opitutales bacterium]
MNNPILECRDIVKSFKSPNASVIEVLRGISFEIYPSESLSLRGESGAGKSTFLNVVSALESLDSGEIYWNGTRVDKLRNAKQIKLRSKFMSFVFQSYCLVPELNALENVTLPARIAGVYNRQYKKRALDILAEVGLANRYRHSITTLSGGEKQRVAIARALLLQPKLILADEPTGNLDEKSAENIMDMFLELCKNEGVALLLITHNPEFAKRTDRQCILKEGKFL